MIIILFLKLKKPMKSSIAAISALLLSTSSVSSQQSFLKDSVTAVTDLGQNSQTTFTGIWKSCPETQIEQNFDKERYLGSWYELHRSKKQNFEDGECQLAVYTDRSDGLLGVENSQAPLLKDGTFGPRNGVNGTAIQYHPERHEGTLGVKFSIFQPVRGPYTILHTDYENFSIIQSCVSYGFFTTHNNWILSRKPLNADDEEYAALVANGKQILESNLPGFKFEDEMRPTIQGASKGCKYYSP